jgi:hypothetical protein
LKRALYFLATACWALRDPSSAYELRLQGAIVATTRVHTESAPVGTSDAPYYTITLSAPGGDAAMVLTRAGSAPPPVGVYQVGDSELGRNGFSGLIITGMPAHPTGVFRVESGTLTIAADTLGRLTGEFELRASGFLTGSPADNSQYLSANGRFAARSRHGRQLTPLLPPPSTRETDR